MEKEIRDKILNLMAVNQISYGELSKRTKLSKSTLQRYMTKEDAKVPIDRLKVIAKGLNTTPSYLMGWAEQTYDEISKMVNYSNIYEIDTQSLPLLGSVACGKPIYADSKLESYVLSGTDIKADFCLKAKGDSMVNARINDGDIVFVRKQDIVNNGEIAVVIIDDEATLKRFYFYKEKNMVILRAENPKYEDIILTGEELNKVKILGKAVAFQSDVE